MYAITTTENNKRLYVSDCSKRTHDSKYLVEYSKAESEAKRFSKGEALEIIPAIHNPFERVFDVAVISGKQKRVIASTEDFS